MRKMIQLVFLLAFPLTFNYFSPYLIVLGAFRGILTGSAILFISLFLFSIFGGRLFCSYLCPAGTIGDYMNDVKGKRVNQSLFKVKWFIWVPWIIVITFGFIHAGNLSVDFLFMTEKVISIDEPFKYAIYFTVLFLIVGLNLFGRRNMCHMACWMAPFMIMGVKLRKVFSLKGLTLKSKAKECVSCQRCNEVCPMSLDVQSMVRNDMTDVNCILCGECIGACSKDVIEFTFFK